MDVTSAASELPAMSTPNKAAVTVVLRDFIVFTPYPSFLRL